MIILRTQDLLFKTHAENKNINIFQCFWCVTCRFTLISRNILTLTGEVNNTDYLFIMAPYSEWDILGSG